MIVFSVCRAYAANITVGPFSSYNVSGQTTPYTGLSTGAELDYVHGVTSAIQTQLSLLAPIANPTFTGTVTADALSITGGTALTFETTLTNSASVIPSGSAIVSYAVPLAGGTLTGKLTTETSNSTNAPFNIPPGSAPTSPNNGDIWTTSSGLYTQVAGATVGPLGSGGGGGTVTDAMGGIWNLGANLGGTFNLTSGSNISDYTNMSGTSGNNLTTQTTHNGHAWTSLYTTVYSGNLLYTTAGTGVYSITNANYYAALTPSSDNYSIGATFTYVSGTGYVGVGGRYTNPTTSSFVGYMFRYVEAAAVWQMFKDGNSPVQLGSNVSQTFTNGTTHTVKLVLADGSQKAYVDGTLMITTTDTTQNGSTGYPTLTIVNDASSTTGFYVTNWEVTTP